MKLAHHHFALLHWGKPCLGLYEIVTGIGQVNSAFSTFVLHCFS